MATLFEEIRWIVGDAPDGSDPGMTGANYIIENGQLQGLIDRYAYVDSAASTGWSVDILRVALEYARQARLVRVEVNPERSRRFDQRVNHLQKEWVNNAGRNIRETTAPGASQPLTDTVSQEIQRAIGVHAGMPDIHHAPPEALDQAAVDARADTVITDRLADDARLLEPASGDDDTGVLGDSTELVGADHQHPGQVYTSAEKTKLSGIEAGAQVNVGSEFTAAEKTKLGGIEAGATADQTGSEIVTALQGLSGANRLDASAVKNLPTGGGGLSTVVSDETLDGTGAAGSPLSVANPFTSTDETKLDNLLGLPTGGATGQLLAKKSATDGDTEWRDAGRGAFTTDDETKLDGIEDGATADQTGPEIVTLLTGLSGSARLPATAVRDLPEGGGGQPGTPGTPGVLTRETLSAAVNLAQPDANTISATRWMDIFSHTVTAAEAARGFIDFNVNVYATVTSGSDRGGDRPLLVVRLIQGVEVRSENYRYFRFTAGTPLDCILSEVLAVASGDVVKVQAQMIRLSAAGTTLNAMVTTASHWSRFSFSGGGGAASEGGGLDQAAVDARVEAYTGQSTPTGDFDLSRIPGNLGIINNAYQAGGIRLYSETFIGLHGPVQATAHTATPSPANWGLSADRAGGFAIPNAHFLIRFLKTEFASMPTLAEANAIISIRPGGEGEQQDIVPLTSLTAISNDAAWWYADATIANFPAGGPSLYLMHNEPATLHILPPDGSITSEQIKGLDGAEPGDLVLTGDDGGFTTSPRAGLRELYSGSVGLTITAANRAVSRTFALDVSLDLDEVDDGVVFAAFQASIPASSSPLAAASHFNGWLEFSEIRRSAVYNGSTNLGEAIITEPFTKENETAAQGNMVMRLYRNASNQVSVWLGWVPATGADGSLNFSISLPGKLVAEYGGAEAPAAGSLTIGYRVEDELPNAQNYPEGAFLFREAGGVYDKRLTRTHGAADTGWLGKHLDFYYNLGIDEITAVSPQRTVRHANTAAFTLDGQTIPIGGNFSGLPGGLAHIYLAYDSNGHGNGELAIVYTAARTYNGPLVLTLTRGGIQRLVRVPRIDSTTWRLTGLSASTVNGLLGANPEVSEPGHVDYVEVHEWVKVADRVLQDPEILNQLATDDTLARNSNNVIEALRYTVPAGKAGRYIIEFKASVDLSGVTRQSGSGTQAILSQSDLTAAVSLAQPVANTVGATRWQDIFSHTVTAAEAARGLMEIDADVVAAVASGSDDSVDRPLLAVRLIQGTEHRGENQRYFRFTAGTPLTCPVSGVIQVASGDVIKVQAQMIRLTQANTTLNASVTTDSHWSRLSFSGGRTPDISIMYMVVRGAGNKEYAFNAHVMTAPDNLRTLDAEGFGILAEGEVLEPFIGFRGDAGSAGMGRVRSGINSYLRLMYLGY